MLHNHNIDVSGEVRIDRTAMEVPDWRWTAVARRDRTADGQFVYAVASTGIFCRPSCPSRRPRPEGVRFFSSSEEALAAGFRACKRCDPASTATPTTSDQAIRRATRFLAKHVDEPVTLAQLARLTGVSAFHLQRRFKRALGVSPREYQAACRANRFREQLRAGRDVAAATYEAGYGSPSRVYESAPTGRGMSPAEYRRGGAGAEIGFATTRSELGWLLIAATAKGICAVKLGDSRAALEAELRREYPDARISTGQFVQPEWVRALVGELAGSTREVDLPLDVRGTAFQWRVWRALQRVQPGETRSYTDIARAIGRPSAVRAVARACATNPVGLVIPCHRVVPKDGSVGQYRWGASRKARLLRSEKKRSKIAPE
jgi:AraC family transcriptional regulator of adaptative response/methylated-DNA-[protein]-cysteine methyltransferase